MAKSGKVTMRKWRCWLPDEGASDDAPTYSAYDAKDAARQFAHEYFAEMEDLDDSAEVNVCVQLDGDDGEAVGDIRVFAVELEIEWNFWTRELHGEVARAVIAGEPATDAADGPTDAG